MIPTHGPKAVDLAALKAWAQQHRLVGADLRTLVQDTLITLGCRNPGDATLYCAYLARLQEGEHDAGLLDGLTVAALQQADVVLLAWRGWVLRTGNTPTGLDSMLLDCLATLLSAKRAASAADDCDHATGLPDRTSLPHVLELARQRTEASRTTALLYVEITAGPHAYPDSLLVQVAGRLGTLLRVQDAMLLIDRQTFGLVLANLNGEGHALLAAHRVLGCFEEQIALDGQSIRLHPRIGIALVPDHGETAEQLLGASATAAREHASDGIGVYDPRRDRLNYALKRLEIPLRKALQENQFHMVFQPQIYCRGHGFYGVESLLRWEDETLGAVRTDELVMVAEHLGLMSSLTHWVLNASLREYAKLLVLGIPGTISINLAPANLRDKELPAAIQDALAVWQVPAHRVVLEITESALIENLDDALESLHGLKQLGCKLALDDFGTGYSSLSYLKRLPIDELKIDRSFIVTMRDSAKEAGIVRTIVELAHLLGLVVVTEGVEDDVTAQLLADMGNDVIQGFCFSKALPPNEIPNFIATLK